MSQQLKPGIPVFDIEVQCLCLKCAVPLLASALSNVDGYLKIGEGVEKQSAVLSEHTLRLIRYRGCEWSSIAPVFPAAALRLEQQKLMLVLSEYLHVDALMLGIHDMIGGARYEYVKDGHLVEHLDFSSEEGDLHFSSELRSLEAGQLGYKHVDTFVRELGIIPPLFWSPFERIGQPIKAQKEIDADWEQVEELFIMDKNKQKLRELQHLTTNAAQELTQD